LESQRRFAAAKSDPNEMFYSLGRAALRVCSQFRFAYCGCISRVRLFYNEFVSPLGGGMFVSVKKHV